MAKGVDPNSGIWDISLTKRHKVDYLLAAAIGMYFDIPDDLADLGCGLGLYCRILGAYNWRCIGFEGTRGIKDIAAFWPIVRVDLSVPISSEFHKRYDFVLCLEVGEHIPQKHEQILLDNICNVATKDIVLSWAVPGQYSASGHVNCRPNDYVINELAKRGFVLDNDMTKKLREVSIFKWFKNTLMVFYVR